MMHIDQLERYWLLAIAGALGAFMAALLASVFVFDVRLPSPAGRVNPTQLETTEFAEPGLRAMGNNQYTLHVIAHMWQFNMGEEAGRSQPVIRVPQGAEVTIIATSQDVTHGLFVEQHNVNLMLMPGQIGRTTVTFDRPGEYRMICHEYCGSAHHAMVATIVVE